MKSNIIIITCALFSIAVNGQPTGESKNIHLKVLFKELNGKRIEFEKRNDSTIISKNNQYRVVSFRKEYNRSLYTDTFIEREYQADSINYLNNIKPKLEFKTITCIPFVDSKELERQHDPSPAPFNGVNYAWETSYKQIGTAYFIPKSDLLLKFYRNEELMTIHFETNKIFEFFHAFSFMEIPFTEGTFKVIDTHKPKLLSLSGE
ncbi:MAG: hypothetical protein AAF090_01270 [Bacteroidota bacterium]